MKSQLENLKKAIESKYTLMQCDIDKIECNDEYNVIEITKRKWNEEAPQICITVQYVCKSYSITVEGINTNFRFHTELKTISSVVNFVDNAFMSSTKLK